MRRNLRHLRTAFAGAIVLALGAAPALAADPAKAQLPASAERSGLGHGQDPDRDERLCSSPGKHIKLRLPTHAQWGGGPHVLLVLDSRMYKGKAWLRVALPDRPNGSSGWIREDFVRLGTTPWRDHGQPRGARRHGLPRRAQAAQLRSRGRQAPATPTPGGLYAVYEKLAQPDPKGFLRPLGAAPHGLLERAPQLRRRARPGGDPRP